MCRLDAFIFFKKWNFCLSTNQLINLACRAEALAKEEAFKAKGGTFLEPISKKWIRVQGKASRELKTERTRST